MTITFQKPYTEKRGADTAYVFHIVTDQHLTAETENVMATLATGSVLFVLLIKQDPDFEMALRAARNSSIRVVPLLYDAKMFHSRAESATDPSYMESLRLSGGMPVVMPVDASSLKEVDVNG